MKRHAGSTAGGRFDLPNPHKRVMGEDPWTLSVAHGEEKSGVVIHMLGGEATTVYRDVGQGVATTIAERRAPKTTFVVLHEPFQGQACIDAFTEIQKTDAGVAARVVGKDVNDCVYLAYHEHSSAPITLGDENCEVTFVGFAHVRVVGSDVLVAGDVKKLSLSAGKQTKRLIVNGEASPADIADGRLTYEAE
jgi:hypothetical protein